MVLNEVGVLEKSFKYFSTPSDLAKKMFYYITRCGHYYCNSEYVFSWKSKHGQLLSRKTYLLFYIISGSLTIEYDEKTYVLSPGQASLIDCHRPHQYWSGTDLEFLWIHLDGANTKLFYEEILRAHGPAFSVGGHSDIEAQIAMAIASCSSGGLARTEVARSHLIYKLLCSLLIPHPNNVSQLSNEVISKALKYIETHAMEDLPVARVAQHVNMSKSHFTRLFKKCTGCPPHEFIVLMRITRAKVLLSSTTMSIKEISFATGYNSEANFICSFSSKVGCTPGQFRNE